jgi:hypothetical protein
MGYNKKSITRQTTESIQIHRDWTIHFWMTKENFEEIRKFLEWNKNGNMIFQNLWGTAKAMWRGKFTAITAYIIKSKRSLNKTLYTPKKTGTSQTYICKLKMITKFCAEFNKMETKEWWDNEIEIRFFENINKIDQAFEKLTKDRGWRCKVIK